MKTDLGEEEFRRLLDEVYRGKPKPGAIETQKPPALAPGTSVPALSFATRGECRLDMLQGGRF